jgi:hypothetical protein
MSPKWQYHCRPPSAVDTFYHRNWPRLPTGKIADQLNLMSAVGYNPKKHFSATRRCHLKTIHLNFTEGYVFQQKSAVTPLRLTA